MSANDPTSSVQAAEILEYEDIRLDFGTRRVTRGGRPIALRPYEYSILAVFMQYKGKVFTRYELYVAGGGRLTGGFYDPDDSVRTCIKRLRRALGKPDVIKNMPKLGYTLPSSDPNTAQPAEILIHEDIELNLSTKRVTRDGRPIVLRPFAFHLLVLFMQNKEREFSARELYLAGGGGLTDNSYDPSVVVRTNIKRLRKALGDPNVIGTVIGQKYKLTDSARAQQRAPGKHSHYRKRFMVSSTECSCE